MNKNSGNTTLLTRTRPSSSPPPASYDDNKTTTTTEMGQTNSHSSSNDSKPSSTSILREDTVHISETPASPVPETPDSFSMNFDCVTQPPYSTRACDKMLTQTSLKQMPSGNDTHDLAYFLRTTGPCAPHRRPGRLEQRGVEGEGGKRKGGKGRAFRFLRFGGGGRKGMVEVEGAHERLNSVLYRDEGMLLNPVVTQRTTSHGKQYLALTVPTKEEQQRRLYEANKPPPTDGVSPITEKRQAVDCHDILESRVSISFADSINSNGPLDTWLLTSSKDRASRVPAGTSAHTGDESGGTRGRSVSTVRMVDHNSSPVRPAASSPPSPEPDSAVSMAEFYQHSLNEHPAKRSLDSTRALSSHPVKVAPNVGAPRAKLALPKEEFPVKHNRSDKDVEIKHPSPRRFASHPVLLQRASSMASTLYPRSVTDSPGPPPPRSPLRLRRDPRNIESVLGASEAGRSATPKVAPSIMGANEYANEAQPVKPTVTTECTGPLSRPRSRGKDKEKGGLTRHTANPMSRKAREERIRSRKLRDKPFVQRNIDTIMHGPPAPPQPAPPAPAPRQRLRKIRPQITIPELKPAPLATRASSTASSIASFRKVTESTLTPISSVSSQVTQIDTSEKSGYTPISATASQRTASSNMTLSPVMLVAEEVPVLKARTTPKPAKLILKEGKSYAPRPRSASIPRNALKRRSRNAAHTPSSRAGSPAPEYVKDDTPPLPSPPPNRALPPTPPASGSEKANRAAAAATTTKKDLPNPPDYEIAPKAPSPPTRKSHHVTSQDQRLSTTARPSHHHHHAKQANTSKHTSASTTSTRSKSATSTRRIDARLEALEKHNALLQAALMAVLYTNGAMNAPLTTAASPGALVEQSPSPSAWESRIARRSEASLLSRHQAGSSNGSALEMYMSTRRGG